MNPVTTTSEQLPPQSKSSSCTHHPDEEFTGFCPSCLCERLAVLDKSAASATTVSSGRKSASSAIKSLFKSNNDVGPRGRPSSSSFLPELRRTKSFSGGGGNKNEGGLLGFEPQRKSCDVRGRSTLFSLLSQHDVNHQPSTTTNNGGAGGVNANEDDEEEEDEEFHDSNDNGNDNEIQVVNEEETIYNNDYGGVVDKSNDDEQMSGDILEGSDLKTMKDHIRDVDLENKKIGSKDLKELAGSFWSKLRAWTKKSKMKKRRTVQVSGVKKGKGRDTQSEIADYGFGRRSCDIDPRFSLDAARFSVDAAMSMAMPGRYSVDAAGRMSFDDVRCSFDEPRASWDGYLMGRNFPKTIPPMVSVVEDAPAPAPVPVPIPRKDGHIPPEEEPRRSSVSMNGDGDDPMPGNAAQTNDYYSDSSSRSRRRKSLDRSSSIRKTAAAVVAEMDHTHTEMKSNNQHVRKISHADVDVDYLQGTKVVASGVGLGVDTHFRDFDLFNSNSNCRSNSLRDFNMVGCSKDYSNAASVLGISSHCDNNNNSKGSKKSSRRWRPWNIWGLLYRRTTANDDDRYTSYRYSSRANGVERSYSHSWNGDPRAGFGRNVFRSNSSVSWRNSSMGGSFGAAMDNSITNDRQKKKDKDEPFVLERNRSAKYSPTPSHADKGMLRFYLTPMRGSQRGSSSSVKPKPAYSHSFARSVLRLY